MHADLAESRPPVESTVEGGLSTNGTEAVLLTTLFHTHIQSKDGIDGDLDQSGPGAHLIGVYRRYLLNP